MAVWLGSGLLTYGGFSLNVDGWILEKNLIFKNSKMWHKFLKCRFQACRNITKLLAVTKAKGQLYHVLEPIGMSLRQHLATAPELMPPSSNRVKLTYLKRILLQVLHGLDYLHDRGWVHFDLSLDSVAVSSFRQMTRSLVAVLEHLPLFTTQSVDLLNFNWNLVYVRNSRNSSK